MSARFLIFFSGKELTSLCILINCGRCCEVAYGGGTQVFVFIISILKMFGNDVYLITVWLQCSFNKVHGMAAHSSKFTRGIDQTLFACSGNSLFEGILWCDSLPIKCEEIGSTQGLVWPVPCHLVGVSLWGVTSSGDSLMLGDHL